MQKIVIVCLAFFGAASFAETETWVPTPSEDIITTETRTEVDPRELEREAEPRPELKMLHSMVGKKEGDEAILTVTVEKETKLVRIEAEDFFGKRTVITHITKAADPEYIETPGTYQADTGIFRNRVEPIEFKLQGTTYHVTELTTMWKRTYNEQRKGYDETNTMMLFGTDEKIQRFEIQLPYKYVITNF